MGSRCRNVFQLSEVKFVHGDLSPFLLHVALILFRIYYSVCICRNTNPDTGCEYLFKAMAVEVTVQTKNLLNSWQSYKIQWILFI